MEAQHDPLVRQILFIINLVGAMLGQSVGMILNQSNCIVGIPRHSFGVDFISTTST